MSTNDANVEVSAGTETPEVAGRRPYTIIFVCDLGAGDRLDQLTPIDKDELAPALSRAKPTLAVAMKDPLAGGPDWELQLTFDNWKAFDPPALLARVPAARWRLGIRDKIAARRQGKIGPAELDSAINAAVEADGSLAWLRQQDGPAAPAAGPPGTSTTPGQRGRGEAGQGRRQR
jgi:hypothetical protein